MGDPQYTIWTLFPEDIRRKVVERDYSLVTIEIGVHTKSSFSAFRTTMIDRDGRETLCCPLGVALFELGFNELFLGSPIGETLSSESMIQSISEKNPLFLDVDSQFLKEAVDCFIEDYDGFAVADLRQALGADDGN